MEPTNKAPDPEKVKAGMAALSANMAKDFLKKKGAYYTEVNANRWRKILARLHTARLPQRIPLNGMSPNTLRSQYYQGLDYLKDHNPECKEMIESTRCMTTDYYIELHIKRKVRWSSYDAAPWRDELDIFITSSSPGQKLERVDVCLSPEEITDIENKLAPLDSLFIWQIEQNLIKVIRYEDNSNDNQKAETPD